MLPNLFFMGFPKCGSTSWHYILKGSKDILTSVHEETPVFSRHDLTKNQLHLLEMKDYRVYRGEKWVLNAHPLSVYSNTTISYIKEYVENPKFIICLRDPIKRSISHYKHLYSLMAENRTLQECLTREVKEDVCWIENMTQYYMKHVYFHQSRYDIYIDNLLKHFPKEDILFLGFEDFFGTEKEQELTKVSEFLDIAPLSDQEIHANKTNAIRVETRQDVNLTLNDVASDGTEQSVTVHADRAVFCWQGDKLASYMINPSNYTWNWFQQAETINMPILEEIKQEFGEFYVPIYRYVSDNISKEIVDGWLDLNYYDT